MSTSSPNGVDGLLYGGGFALLRVGPEVEEGGVDVHLHAESAHDLFHPIAAGPARETTPSPAGRHA